MHSDQAGEEQKQQGTYIQDSKRFYGVNADLVPMLFFFLIENSPSSVTVHGQNGTEQRLGWVSISFVCPSSLCVQ